jgi:CzcA family heavy metal efflux pump
MSEPPPRPRWNLLVAARPYFGAAVLAVAFLLGAGAWSIFHIPSGIYPEVAFPRIVVIASVPGLAIRSVEVGVTRNLEKALGVVLGVTRVHSKTVRGASEISVDFAPATDTVQALNDVRARIAEIGSSLPPLAGLIVERQTPSVFPIITVAVSGNRTPAELRDYAFYDLQPRLARLPDVSYVTVQGGDVREVLIEADPAALAAAHLSVDELAREVGRSARLQAVGRLDRGPLQYQVMADTLDRPESLEDLAVAGKSGEPLRLGDLASVSISHEDRLVAVRSDGEDAVALTVFRRLGGDALTVSRALGEVLAEAARTAPAGIRAHVSYDQADLVRTSLANVRDAILVGGLFSILTLFAFLWSLRATLIALVSIPTTLVISFTFIRLSGDTLNLMSLGGLAIAIGLIIDDTVVVIENIARHLEGGGGGDAAIEAASREISGAVIGSTLTTVLVFVPLAFLHGVVGQFFQSLCLSLGVAVLVSMAVSLTVIPLLAARFLGARSMPRPGALYERAADFYEAALRGGLQRPRLSLVLAVLVIVPAVLLYRGLEQDFMPVMDEGAFVLDYFMPVGTSLTETDRAMRKVEGILRETPEVKSYIRRTGAELGFFATEPYTGDVLVSLSPERDRSMEDVIEGLRREIAARVPELPTVEFVPLIRDQINDMKGVEAPVEVKVFGPDYAVLRKIAAEAGERIGKVPGAVDVSEVRQGNPDIVVRTDSAAARRAGLAADAVSDQVEGGLYGTVAFTLPEEDRLTAVRVRYPDRVRFDREGLSRIPIATPSGDIVPLGAVAGIEEEWTMNELLRENAQPMVSVTAEIEGAGLGTVTRGVRAALADLQIPRGYRWELAGEFGSQQEAFLNLLVVLVVGAGLVFFLLALQFRSLVLPILIFLTQPLSLTAALAALWITGTPLNVSSLMGAILLVGLDVKNGILLIEYTGQLRRAGATLTEALVRAGRTRFRPILMTSLATIFGLLPLALGLGPGAQMQKPLAIAVIGGLAANMVFTRLIIPVGYAVMVRERGGGRSPVETPTAHTDAASA